MKPPVSRADAKLIAECCGDLADKALNWKARALAAEEALRKFAGEIYSQPTATADAELAERLRHASRFCSGYEPSLSLLQITAEEAADRLSPAQGGVTRRDETGTGSVAEGDSTRSGEA